MKSIFDAKPAAEFKYQYSTSVAKPTLTKGILFLIYLSFRKCKEFVFTGHVICDSEGYRSKITYTHMYHNCQYTAPADDYIIISIIINNNIIRIYKHKSDICVRKGKH